MTSGTSQMPDMLFSRPLAVADVPPEGLDVAIEASEQERAAIAADFGLLALDRLTGAFHVSGSETRLAVTGRIEAVVAQTCVVTLDPFTSNLAEDVDVVFADEATLASLAAEPLEERALGQGDPPDLIVGGEIDLGALATEFLALGLDPYPRKPGVEFSFEAAEGKADSPFAALARLKGRGGDGN